MKTEKKRKIEFKNFGTHSVKRVNQRSRNGNGRRKPFFSSFFTGKGRKKNEFYFLMPNDLEEFNTLCNFVGKLTSETAGL